MRARTFISCNPRARGIEGFEKAYLIAVARVMYLVAAAGTLPVLGTECTMF